MILVGAATIVAAAALVGVSLGSSWLGARPSSRNAARGGVVLMDAPSITPECGLPSADATGVVTTPSSPAAAFTDPIGTLVTDLASQYSPCVFTAQYTGTTGAYLAADILVASGDRTHPELWNATRHFVRLLLTDGATHTVIYSLPTSTSLVSCTTGVHPQFGSVATGSTMCGEIDDDLLATTPISDGMTYSLSLSWVLPTPVPAAIRGGTAQVYVVFHAVRAGNGPLRCSAPAQIGASCSPTGGFSW